MKNYTGKHINELVAQKTKKLNATIKQLQTKIKKVNRKLKLREMEQLADFYKMQRQKLTTADLILLVGLALVIGFAFSSLIACR